MFVHRQLLVSTISAVLILVSSSYYDARGFTASLRANTSSQTEERDQGIKLFELGETAGAIKALQAFVKRQNNDIRAWHYLGLALSRSGKTNDARKAHEKAARLGTKVISDHLDGMSSAFELYTRIRHLKSALDQAADSADKYLELSSKPSKSKISEWRERAESLRSLSELIEELKDNRIFMPADVTTRARIISKPSPQYTEEARQNAQTGTVVLLLVFSADGKVRGFFPVARLPYGLTESAIEVARKIRFTPATKDGKSVSQFIRVEYNFNIY